MKKFSAISAVLCITTALSLTACEGRAADATNNLAGNCWDCTAEATGSDDASCFFDCIDCSVCIFCYGEGCTQGCVSGCSDACGQYCHEMAGEDTSEDSQAVSPAVSSASYTIEECGMRGTNEYKQVKVKLNFSLLPACDYERITVHTRLWLPDGRVIVSSKVSNGAVSPDTTYTPEFEYYVENDGSDLSAAQKYTFDYLIHG